MIQFSELSIVNVSVWQSIPPSKGFSGKVYVSFKCRTLGSLQSYVYFDNIQVSQLSPSYIFLRFTRDLGDDIKTHMKTRPLHFISMMMMMRLSPSYTLLGLQGLGSNPGSWNNRQKSP